MIQHKTDEILVKEFIFLVLVNFVKLFKLFNVLIDFCLILSIIGSYNF